MGAPPRDNNICPSCGVEFGHDDCGRNFSELRREWIRDEAPWSSRLVPRPIDWNPYVQMLNAGFIDITVGGSADLTISMDEARSATTGSVDVDTGIVTKVS